jgi:hypothetical protein
MARCSLWDQEIEMADITYATDGNESNFVAETPAGEEFLGGPELTVPDHEAEAFLERARAAGLTILPFP